jgi:hypothetical protein
MADLAFLPRVLVGRTEYGTAFYFDRRLGLLASTGPAGALLRPIEPDELRRGYPLVWTAWVRLAAMLPDSVLNPRPGGPVDPGGRAA